MLNRGNYKDVTIINNEGKIIYADIGNLQYFSIGLNNVKGKKLKELYIKVTNNHPLLKAINEGKAYNYFETNMVTSRGINLMKKGCAYPIFFKGEPIAAIEFSDSFYDKSYIEEIKNHAEHPIYRANNTKYLIDDIITGDKSIIELKKKIVKFATSESTVLIYGETGTGKELVAQAIHNKSKRYYKKFTSINCGAIPSNLLESILFGTTKGSFTGAEDKPGLFELSEGGTLFLDEINSLDVRLQIKILKAIEGKKIRRIGSGQETDVDVRIIAATNEEPTELIKGGKLKPDLFYRLAVIYIRLPKLIDRGNDVIILSNHFINYFNKKMNCNIKTLDYEIMDIFMKYSWPGNVRELRNAIEGAFAFAENDTITLQEIPKYIIRAAEKQNKKFRTFSGSYGMNLSEKLMLIEKVLVNQAYQESNYRLTRASEMLGISKQLMLYKLKKYGRWQ